MKLEDKTIFKNNLIKMRTEMIVERNELYSPGRTHEINGKDVKQKDIDWFTRQAAELSRLIEELEEEGLE